MQVEKPMHVLKKCCTLLDWLYTCFVARYRTLAKRIYSVFLLKESCKEKVNCCKSQLSKGGRMHTLILRPGGWRKVNAPWTNELETFIGMRHWMSTQYEVELKKGLTCGIWWWITLNYHQSFSAYKTSEVHYHMSWLSSILCKRKKLDNVRLADISKCIVEFAKCQYISD